MLIGSRRMKRILQLMMPGLALVAGGLLAQHPGLYLQTHVAENRDEERILNLNQWSVKREQFTQETAIHLLTLPLHHVAGLAKEPSAT